MNYFATITFHDRFQDHIHNIPSSVSSGYSYDLKKLENIHSCLLNITTPVVYINWTKTYPTHIMKIWIVLPTC